MKKLIYFLLLFLPISLAAQEHTLHVFSTGDVHGSYFDERYLEGELNRPSLYAVKQKVDSVRNQVGADNVLLLDLGDGMQGDDAAYYCNYVAVDAPHLFPRMVSYMGYDALVVGNHDIETGHPVYDRVKKELDSYGLPWLAANALKEDGHPYFGDYKVFEKAGLKVLVMGFTNANIKEWLDEKLWKGICFESIAEVAQSRVDAAVAKEKPQVVIVAVHSGTGKGDGKQPENEGLDLLAKLHGVDLLICSHDHKPFVKNTPGFSLMNGGARCTNIGHATITVKNEGSKLTGKSVEAETVRIDRNSIDFSMKEKFLPDFKLVREFSRRPVGSFSMELRTRDAYSGVCDYMNLLHTIQLEASGANISLAAPLTYNGIIKSGVILFGNLFTVYPYENELYVLNLSGKELVEVLEYSYDTWICTPGEHALKIHQKSDARNGTGSWSFVNRPYNFDSAAGIIYTVDMTAAKGSRVKVTSLADGSPFDMNATYAVAMTSYRANGGGGLLSDGAGISPDDIDGRLVARYPEIRELISDWIKKNVNVTRELISDKSRLGGWKFVPEEVVAPLMKKDMELLF